MENYIIAVLEHFQAEPRKTEGGWLLKGLCHNGNQHSVSIDIETGMTDCPVCGKKFINDYLVAAWGEDCLKQYVYHEDLFEKHYNDAPELKEAVRQVLKQTVERCVLKLIAANDSRQWIREDFYFRGKPIKLKKGLKVTTKEESTPWGAEEVSKISNEYLWCWGGNEMKRGEFFEAAFKDFCKYKKRVVFSETATDNLMLLSTTQRQKLIYEILAQSFPLVEVDKNDEIELLNFCRSDTNYTMTDTAIRLMWKDGLAKMVTFGLGLRLDGEAKQTWCYSVDELPSRRRYYGLDEITWEEWKVDIISKLADLVNADTETAWTEIRKIVFCQGNKRLTLEVADRHRIFGYITNYLQNGFAEWPQELTGVINKEAHDFVIDFYADTEIVDSYTFNKKGMAAFNKQKGMNQVLDRFMAAFPEAKGGDVLTTKQLKAAGYDDKKAIQRLVKHEILENYAYGKYRVLYVK